MYEDSIQELNDLIGELDSFQKEHELKMQHDRNHRQPITHFNDYNNAATSAPADISDIYSNFDKLSMCSNEPNPLMCSTQSVHSSELTFSSDTVDGIDYVNNADGRSNVSLSLKINLSGIIDPSNSCSSASDNNNSSNSSNLSNGLNGIAQNIQLIPESYNVPDKYLREHTEIVVLRRKDSVSEMNSPDEKMNQNIDGNGRGKELERISSFRCTSFSKADKDSPSPLGKSSMLTNKRRSNSGNDVTVYDRNNTIKMASAAHHAHVDDTQIRHKPIVTPRPASLTGLF